MLWEHNKQCMVEDAPYECRLKARQPDMDYNDYIFNEALMRLSDSVELMAGQTLDVYGLPIPERHQDDNRLERNSSREVL